MIETDSERPSPTATPYWRSILLDGYAPTWAEAARSLYRIGIEPSCRAIAQELAATPRGENNQYMDRWEDLRSVQMELHRSFALSIGALWERNFRNHLEMSAAIIQNPASKSLLKDIRGGDWKRLCHSFKRVRGFDLQWFPQYEDLHLLNLISTAIRHGDGTASKTLAEIRADLFLEYGVRTGWFAYFNGDHLAEKTMRKLDIPLVLLHSLTETVASFWHEITILRQRKISAD